MEGKVISKPKILDLFCGAGGAAMGLHRAGFEVVGVDIKPQPHYPFPFRCMDALEVMDILLRGEGIEFTGSLIRLFLNDLDAYWASPPCQAYCDNNISKPNSHSQLIEPTRARLMRTGRFFIIENVQKAPLKASVLLCGTMFGLHVIRHRYFEMNFAPPMSPYSCNHWGPVINADFAPVYGRGSKGRRYIELDEKGRRVKKRIGRGKPPPNGWTFKQWYQYAMAIDWMQTQKELTEAIPPAYSEYLGKYLMQEIESKVMAL